MRNVDVVYLGVGRGTRLNMINTATYTRRTPTNTTVGTMT
jgi:hypothetical protein